MAWYDVFSNFYDAALEPLYAEHRKLAAAALELRPDSCVLDVPCGTGQSFRALSQPLSGDGLVLGVDQSAGMSSKARAYAVREALHCVRVLQHDAVTLEAAMLDAAAGRPVRVTHLHIFLGMSVFSNEGATFEHLWQLLAPGGRCVLVDVYAERLGLQGWLVNQIAGADIRRKFWAPLEARASEFRRYDLPYRRQHGGQIMLATGVKRE